MIPCNLRYANIDPGRGSLFRIIGAAHFQVREERSEKTFRSLSFFLSSQECRDAWLYCLERKKKICLTKEISDDFSLGFQLYMQLLCNNIDIGQEEG